MIDFLMDFDDAAWIVNKLGWDGWVEFVSNHFPKHNLYSSTMDWLKSPHEYNAKLKGAAGDVIVGWKHDH